MPPSEDAQLLLRIVQRHLRALEFGLDERFPRLDWGFTAQQPLEKLLKCWIVLADEELPAVMSSPSCPPGEAASHHPPGVTTFS